MPTSQGWFSNDAGAYTSNDTLSTQLRTIGQPMFRYRQFADAQQEYGRKSGKKFYFDRVSNLSGTTDGAYLSELSPIPRAAVTVSQGSATAREHGKAVAWSELFESFSEMEVKGQIIVNSLVNNMARNVDYTCYAEGCNLADVVYTPTGTDAAPTATWATNASAGAAATRRLQVYDIKNQVDTFNNGTISGTTYAPAEPWDGENYTAVGSVSALRSVSDDPEWERAQYYGDPEKLFSGEKGRIYGCRLMSDNHIAGLSSGAYTDEITMFAKNAVIEIVCTAEEIRDDLSGDFERDRASAWYCLNGFAPVWGISSANGGAFTIIRTRST